MPRGFPGLVIAEPTIRCALALRARRTLTRTHTRHLPSRTAHQVPPNIIYFDIHKVLQKNSLRASRFLNTTMLYESCSSSSARVLHLPTRAASPRSRATAPSHVRRTFLSKMKHMQPAINLQCKLCVIVSESMHYFGTILESAKRRIR